MTELRRDATVNYDSFGYALAMRVLQSDLYRQLDERERGECDELARRGMSPPSEKAEKYAKDNPLGGPAKMFEAIASRIRAGEDYYAVLDDYDLQHKSPPSASEEKPMKFIYLLNAFEAAAQSPTPFEAKYAEKRKALLDYVAKLESPVSPAAAPDPYPDNEADGVVFCGKCGGQR